MPPEWREWWAAQPAVTKWVGLASAAVPLACNVFPLATALVVWHWPLVRGLQLWRCATCFFVARLDFGLLMALYMRVRFLALLEASAQYSSSRADLLWALVVMGTLLNAANVFLLRASLWDGLTLAVVHVWAQLHAAQPVSFLFGIRIPAAYLPPALAAVTFLQTADVRLPLAALAVGHAYYVGAFVRGPFGPCVFGAPRWLRSLVDGGTRLSNATSSSIPPVTRKETAPSGFRAFSGTANRLGKVD